MHCGPLDWQFKHSCQLFSANNMFEVMICIAKPFFGGSVNSMEEDLQQTVTNMSQLLLWFDAALCAFLDALTWHLLGCRSQIKFDLRYSLYPVTYSDMACLFVVWNMLSKIVISMLMYDKSKWFGLIFISTDTEHETHVAGVALSVWNHSINFFQTWTPFAFFVTLSFYPFKRVSPLNR